MPIEQKHKDEISNIVREYGSLYDDGFDVLARGNIVECKVSRKNFLLKFTSKNPTQQSIKVTLTRSKPHYFTNTGLKYPSLKSLSADQLKTANSIFKKEKDLWIITSMNNRAIHLDLSQGYESIKTQKLIYHSSRENEKPTVEIKTLFNNPYAIILYKIKYANDLAIWINLETQAIGGAAWLEFPKNGSRIISKRDFDFIDNALKKNGDFGVYGNVTQGLASQINYFDVSIGGFDNSDTYSMSVNPKDGHGHFLHFDINKKTGEIGSPMAGHSIPAPSPKDLGIE